MSKRLFFRRLWWRGCGLCRSARDWPLYWRNWWFNVPSHLHKSMIDPFSYALKLRDGTVIQYSQACWCGWGWLHLSPDEPSGDPMLNTGEFSFDRGICVRIADVVWVADAPFGS